MSGRLFVTQYANYGDVQWETPVEPAQASTMAYIGDANSRPIIAPDTHYVVLLATMSCRVCFVPDSEDPDDPVHEQRAWPLPQDTQVERLCHQATKFIICSYPGY